MTRTRPELPNPLVALGYAGLGQEALVCRLAAEVVRQCEQDRLPIETRRREARALVLRSGAPCPRSLVERVLVEAARQWAIRERRREARADITVHYDQAAARAALAEVRRCRALGIEFAVRPGYFQVRSGKGWRPVSWRARR